ncbi:hypothetical protein KQ307_03270 [Synechococcus sp. CS-1326]|nr:hypothetical protein [Synechococcus sp. CS-1326]
MVARNALPQERRVRMTDDPILRRQLQAASTAEGFSGDELLRLRVRGQANGMGRSQG